jgi:hypothetical protein
MLSALAAVFVITGALGLNFEYSISLDVPIRIEHNETTTSSIASETSSTIHFSGSPQSTILTPLKEIRTPERFFFFCALLCNVFTMYMLVVFSRDAREGKPFRPLNARRIRWVGLTLIMSGVFGDASGYILANRLLSTPCFWGMKATTELDFDGGFLVIGMLIILFAEAFRLGAHLQHEQDLTV